MYGDKWTQAFGWFPRLAALEGGVDPVIIENYLPDKCPLEVRETLDEFIPIQKAFNERIALHGARSPSNEARLLKKRAQSLRSRVFRYFTSEARVAFGFKRVGEGWVNETMLFQIVQQLLPTQRLLRHYRPEWLGGLELDIFVPALNVGIEYQGEQHSSAVEHWGGKKALAEQIRRDTVKRERCIARGCTLVEIWAGAPLTIESVLDALRAKKVPAGPALNSRGDR